MYKLDLHTHSHASPDGSLRLEDYERMLAGTLDIVAITDHDSISFAVEAKAKLGDRIIIGEEISTLEGEIIGLYLSKKVEPGLSATDTVQAIHAQGGIVYVPHPFETVRKGLPLTVLDTIAASVDIMEVGNGRAVFQDKSAQARKWAAEHHTAMAASSDAHGWHGWGKTYSAVSALPTLQTLASLLRQPTTEYKSDKVGLRGIMYPKINRHRNKIT